jgi:hypothetical protein
MSFEADDSTFSPSFFAASDDSDSISSTFLSERSQSDGYEPSPYPQGSLAQPGSASSLTGWCRLLKRESDNSRISVCGKDLRSDVCFYLGESAPKNILARVDMIVCMLFGSSLQSRLRGLWNDSSFNVEFYLVADSNSVRFLPTSHRACLPAPYQSSCCVG